MSSGAYAFKPTDLQRAIRAIQNTGGKGRVEIERGKLVVLVEQAGSNLSTATEARDQKVVR
jgi:hypothetical protein